MGFKKIYFVYPDYAKILYHIGPSLLKVLRSIAILEKEFDLCVVDFFGEKLNEKKIKNKIDDADIVAIIFNYTATSRTLKIADVAKRLNKKVILFGGQPSIIKLALKNLNVDFAVTPDEFSIVSLIKMLNSKKISPQNINGIGYKIDDKIYFTSIKYESLNKLPFPAWHAIDINRFLIPTPFGFPIFTEMSRGCPYNCPFCRVHPINEPLRFRSIEKVINEIKYALSLSKKVSYLFFADSVFTVNRDRVIKLCNEMIERNVKIAWGCQTRIDLIDEELLRVMKKAGCSYIRFGLESGSKRIRKILNKDYDTRKTNKIFKLCKELGVYPSASFIVGLPKETKGDLDQTIKLIKKLRPAFPCVNYFIPIPEIKLTSLISNFKSPNNLEEWDAIIKSLPLSRFKEYVKGIHEKISLYRYRDNVIGLLKRFGLRSLPYIYLYIKGIMQGI